MADSVGTTAADTGAAESADTGDVRPLSDAEWEADVWSTDDIPENREAKFQRELDEMLDAEEADDSDEDVERGDAKRHTDKAKDDVQRIAAKATKPKKSEPEPQKAPTYKVKLDKEEREVPADRVARALGMSEAGLAALEPGVAERLYQLRWHANQEQQAGVLARQQFERFVGGLKGDPVAALEAVAKDHGIPLNFRELATEHLARHFEEQSLPPEQRELVAAKRQLEAIKQQMQAAAQAAEEARQAEQRQKWANDLRTEIEGALEAGGIPRDTRMLKRVVEIMQRERAENGDDATLSSAKDLIPALESELDADIKVRFSALGAAEFSRRFPEIAKAVNAHSLAEARKRASGGQFQAEAPQEPAQRRGPPKRERVKDLPWMK